MDSKNSKSNDGGGGFGIQKIIGSVLLFFLVIIVSICFCFFKCFDTMGSMCPCFGYGFGSNRSFWSSDRPYSRFGFGQRS